MDSDGRNEPVVSGMPEAYLLSCYIDLYPEGKHFEQFESKF